MPKCLICSDRVIRPDFCKSCDDEAQRLSLEHVARNPALPLETVGGSDLKQAKFHMFRAVEHSFRALELVRETMVTSFRRTPLKKAA